MPGRPLSAETRENRDGSVSIRVPVARGSTERVTLRFPSIEQANRYRTALLAAWNSDLPLPNPEPFRTDHASHGPTTTSDSFAEVALAWWRRAYPESYKNPETAERVGANLTTHLIPYFSARVDRISDITAEHCEEFVDFMAGKRVHPPSPRAVVAEARDFTLAEAATWSGKSKATIRKAYLNNKFPNAYRDHLPGRPEFIRVPVADLISAGYVPTTKATEVPYGYARKNVNEMLSALRRIFTYAKAHKLTNENPAEGLLAIDPVPEARSAKLKFDKPLVHFDLSMSRQIAGNLHIHHQLAFWIIRLTGLRISEAFGIDLRNIHRFGDHMVLEIQEQGGKRFKTRNDKGEVVISTKKSHTKTRASTRMIPVTPQLAALIDLYVEAFHPGDPHPKAQLIKTKNRTGQGGFRTALATANALAGYGEADVGFEAGPHMQRAFFITDLDNFPEQRSRSVYVGHLVQSNDGGAKITEKNYTLPRSGFQHLLTVVDHMGSLIESTIGNLVEPAPANKLAPKHRTPNQSEREHALEVLDAAGLIGVPKVDNEPVIDMHEAAEMLAVSFRHVRTLASEGHLVRRRIQSPGRTIQFGVTLASVQARLELDQSTTSRRDLQSEFGLSYRELDVLISRLGIEPTGSGTLGHRYTEEETDRLRQYFKNAAALSESAVSKADAAREIGCTRRTIDRFLGMGRLELHEKATTDFGMTMITRESVDRVIQERTKRATLPPIRPPGSIPILEAQKRTGLSRVQVLELKKRGVTVHRTPDYQFHIDEASLEQYLKGDL